MIELTDEELLTCYHRHTVETFQKGDPRWSELVEKQRKKQGKRRLKQALFGGLTSHFKRTQEKVQDSYEEAWQGSSAIEQALSKTTDLCEWRDEGAVARSPATPAIHNLLIARSLRAIQPKSVIEVGSGNGLHLFTLSSLFPDTTFQGAELTAAGVAEAEKIKALPAFPKAISGFAFDPVLDDEAYRRVDFRQASAADLPFEDGSIDVVYTSLALEQMEEIRDIALASVARVAGRYVVMAEPFRDFNKEGIRHDYVRSRDIFSAHVEDLPRFGLEPVYTRSDIPCKVTLGVGLVIAKKAD